MGFAALSPSCGVVKKRAAGAALSLPVRFDASGRVVGELDRAGAGAVVGLDVDQRDASLLDLLLGALQGRADLLGLLDIFAVAAEPLGHLVVARVAEVAARLVALRV